jgi:hypothetical protein
MTTTSPWSRQASPSVTLPPPAPPPAAPTMPPAPIQLSPAGVPGPAGFRPPRPRRRLWGWAVLAVILVAGLSAAVGSAVTYVAMRDDHAAPAQTVSAPPVPAAPHFSAAEADAAKGHLCQVFDVSVRGQEGQGGVRVAGGDVNVPIVLRSINSAAAVQNALVPAVPADVASAARKYISTTLDVTTAAMGSTPTSEVNRLTDVNNDAIYALVDACGLPR